MLGQASSDLPLFRRIVLGRQWSQKTEMLMVYVCVDCTQWGLKLNAACVATLCCAQSLQQTEKQSSGTWVSARLSIILWLPQEGTRTTVASDHLASSAEGCVQAPERSEEQELICLISHALKLFCIICAAMQVYLGCSRLIGWSEGWREDRCPRKGRDVQHNEPVHSYQNLYSLEVK